MQPGQERGDDVLAGTLPALGIGAGADGAGEAALGERDVDLVRRVLAALYFRLEIRAPPRQVGHSSTLKVLAAARERLGKGKFPDLRLRQTQSGNHRPSFAPHTRVLHSSASQMHTPAATLRLAVAMLGLPLLLGCIFRPEDKC